MIKSFARPLLKLPFKATIPRYFINQPNQDKTKREENFVYEEIKANQAVSRNLGMNQFLMRVYNTAGLSVIGALGSSYMFMSMPFVYTNMGISMILGIAMTLGGFIGAQSMQPMNVVERINGV